MFELLLLCLTSLGAVLIVRGMCGFVHYVMFDGLDLHYAPDRRFALMMVPQILLFPFLCWIVYVPNLGVIGSVVSIAVGAAAWLLPAMGSVRRVGGMATSAARALATGRKWFVAPTGGLWNFREFWKLFGFLFGPEMLEQVYEPGAEELTVSYTKARRLAKYRLAVWWLNFCFTVRTAGLVFACIRYSLTDKAVNLLLGLLPPSAREFVRALLGLPPSIE